MNISRKQLKSFFSHSGVIAAYLFGSHAAGTATSESDVDFAVLLPGALSKQQRFGLRVELMHELSRRIKKPIDLIVLNDATPFFSYCVVNEGALLYQTTDVERVDFESRSLSEYFDFEPFLFAYNKRYVAHALQQDRRKA